MSEITVPGHGTASAPADTMTVTLGVSSRRRSVAAAARNRAWADAEACARQLAELSGRSLGRAETIAEAAGPMLFARPTAMMDRAVGGTPIEAGTREVEVDLTVTFALVD